MNPQKKPQPKKLTHRITRTKDMQTNYANMVRVVHTPHEFVLDFGQIIPGDMMLPINSRIIMTPIGTKLLLKALEDNLEKYEKQHGEVVLPERPTLADQLFKNINVSDEETETPQE